jgi:hypothetical protein
MGRVYSAVFEGISVSAAQDLFEIQAPSDAAVRVLACYITNESSETSEQLAFAIKRGEGSVTSGSGGAAVTPRPMAKGSPAFGGSVERNNTTQMAVGTGAIVTLHREGANVVGSGFAFVPQPGAEPIITPGDFLTVELINAPAAALTMSGVIIFEEIGG